VGTADKELSQEEKKLSISNYKFLQAVTGIKSYISSALESLSSCSVSFHQNQTYGDSKKQRSINPPIFTLYFRMMKTPLKF